MLKGYSEVTTVYKQKETNSRFTGNRPKEKNKEEEMRRQAQSLSIICLLFGLFINLKPFRTFDHLTESDGAEIHPHAPRLLRIFFGRYNQA